MSRVFKVRDMDSADSPPPESFAQNGEDVMAWNYFNRKTDGFFVEVGANHPTTLSQTWFLEQRGWKGILVEPLPSCCRQLGAQRKNSTVCEAAVGAPEQTGQAVLNVAASDVWSHLGESKGLEVVQRITVAVRTLDAILDECNAPAVDFLSIDTEGTELDVLRGLNLQKRRPALLVIEDHMDSLDVFFFMRRHGYKLIHRTPPNNWWAPAGAKSIPMKWSARLSLWNLLWFKKPRRRLRWLLGLGAAK
jgi:FkbM family methyltransferase